MARTPLSRVIDGLYSDSGRCAKTVLKDGINERKMNEHLNERLNDRRKLVAEVHQTENPDLGR